MGETIPNREGNFVVPSIDTDISVQMAQVPCQSCSGSDDCEDHFYCSRETVCQPCSACGQRADAKDGSCASLCWALAATTFTPTAIKGQQPNFDQPCKRHKDCTLGFDYCAVTPTGAFCKPCQDCNGGFDSINARCPNKCDGILPAEVEEGSTVAKEATTIVEATPTPTTLTLTPTPAMMTIEIMPEVPDFLPGTLPPEEVQVAPSCRKHKECAYGSYCATADEEAQGHCVACQQCTRQESITGECPKRCADLTVQQTAPTPASPAAAKPCKAHRQCVSTEYCMVLQDLQLCRDCTHCADDAVFGARLPCHNRCAKSPAASNDMASTTMQQTMTSTLTVVKTKSSTTMPTTAQNIASAATSAERTAATAGMTVATTSSTSGIAASIGTVSVTIPTTPAPGPAVEMVYTHDTLRTFASAFKSKALLRLGPVTSRDACTQACLDEAACVGVFLLQTYGRLKACRLLSDLGKGRIRLSSSSTGSSFVKKFVVH